MYDDFRGQGKPAKTKPEGDRPGRSHPRYISGWHVERHQVRWPSDGDEHGRDSANWIADAPKQYSESTGLRRGWYALVRSKVMGGRGRHPSVAAAVAPELATGALVSKRLHVIGERQGSRSEPPGPIDGDLAVGIAAWVTSTPVERASWPEYGKRINRSTIIETAWPSRAALARLGQQLTGSERDDEVDDACQTTARTEFRRSGRSPSPSHSRRTPESTDAGRGNAEPDRSEPAARCLYKGRNHAHRRRLTSATASRNSRPDWRAAVASLLYIEEGIKMAGAGRGPRVPAGGGRGGSARGSGSPGSRAGPLDRHGVGDHRASGQRQAEVSLDGLGDEHRSRPLSSPSCSPTEVPRWPPPRRCRTS